MAGRARILIDFVDAHNVGHVVEALRYAAGHRAANPDAHIGLVLNAASPSEMATWAGTVDEVFTIPLYEGVEAMAGAAAGIPAEWDYVLDDLRRTNPVQLDVVPGFADWWPIADAHFEAAEHRGYCGIPPQPPGYVPHQTVRLDLPAAARASAGDLVPGGSPRIAVVPAGSSARETYPSAAAWTDVIGAITDRWPDAVVALIGKTAADGRTTTQVSGDEHAALAGLPGVVDVFDRPLAEQLAVVEGCDAFLSTHTGFGLAALAVATPWVCIAGGAWPEYFFNGVPFRSVMPPAAFGSFSLYEPVPTVEDDEGEGRRQLHVTRGRIREDTTAILDAIEALAAGQVGYDEAVADHFRRLSDVLGDRADQIFSIDMVHLRHLPAS
ncbi:hypothetical protein [Euzebya sp.]|uniref:hypothetical protein n=1 Tax=Euzebya sp. TaxID=1971409 RepID=UPI00351449B1